MALLFYKMPNQTPHIAAKGFSGLGARAHISPTVDGVVDSLLPEQQLSGVESGLRGRRKCINYPVHKLPLLSCQVVTFLVVNLVLSLTDLYLLQCARKERNILKRLPPGPTPKPIIGSNLLDLPPPGAPEWLHWLKHKELYGKATIQIANTRTHRINLIPCLSRANQLSNDLWSIIIANGHRAVIDLMEKSSGSKISTQLVSWLRLAEKDKAYKKRAKAMTDILYAFVEQQLARQKHIPSYVSRLPKRDQVEPGSEEKLVAKRPAQSIYGGGAETSGSAFACLFHGMVLYWNV
ncbi:hypothetical protein ETB97_000483 [Aspergillus alliaceus]|uniref:Cytochrome P450 n=1 Tax=Petromyces alliaceus TaxID=209559 RepID=A0A8H6E7C9_PETAA|nr:hypothetical protein ETB97_000483 [Aspergillus burnettii]